VESVFPEKQDDSSFDLSYALFIYCYSPAFRRRDADNPERDHQYFLDLYDLDLCCL
jgi:hypothetical protein